MTGLVDELEALIPFLESHHCSAEPIRKAVAQMTTVSPDKDEVKRVARALCKSHKLDPDRQIASMLDGQTSYPQWTAFSTYARVAIAAMPPVDRLREALGDAQQFICEKFCGCSPDDREHIEKCDEIRAALSSPEPVGEVSE